MSWSHHHAESERLAQEAHSSLRKGDHNSAEQFFKRAADEETRALESLAPEKPRTYGITAVSALSLMLKSGALEEAERLAYKLSHVDLLPAFARDQIRSILQTIWNRQAQEAAGIMFAPNQLLVSVRGGDVVRGGAPLELIVEKVQEVSNLIYRTVEYLAKKPLRKRGRAPKDVHERCVPWLFQSVPGSYQFVVAIQSKPQLEMFEDEFSPTDVSQKLMDILKSATESPDIQIKEIVAEEDYRNTFLKLTRNLAPTGKSFNEIEISNAAETSTAIVLSQASRNQISETLARPPLGALSAVIDDEIVEIKGTLRALDLDKDTIEVDCGHERQRVRNAGDIVDDVIGPMVNHKVIVKARRKKGSTKLIFVDIERTE
jgi:hypothetical protein